MKFGQLIEYIMRRWESCTKYDAESIPRPFAKKTKLSISLKSSSIQSKILYSLILLYAKVRTIEIYWN